MISSNIKGQLTKSNNIAIVDDERDLLFVNKKALESKYFKVTHLMTPTKL